MALAWAIAAGAALGLLHRPAMVARAAPVAQAPPRAGVVVQFPDGAVREACVELPGGPTTGMDLLRLAGFDAIAEVTALGAKVCSIDGAGCPYPEGPCWCECRSLGQACTYWVYHQALDGGWRYSTLGASDRRVQAGDVDGWAWGSGGEGYGAEPPYRGFADVCSAVTPSPEPSATAAPGPIEEPGAEPPTDEAPPEEDVADQDTEGDAAGSAATDAGALDLAGAMGGPGAGTGTSGSHAAAVPTFAIPAPSTLQAMRTELASAALLASATPTGGGPPTMTPGAITLTDGAATQAGAAAEDDLLRLEAANRKAMVVGYGIGALLMLVLLAAGRMVGRRGHKP